MDGEVSLAIWIFGFLAIWISGSLAIWISCSLAIRISAMDLWHQGYLNPCDGFIFTLWMVKSFSGDLDLWFSGDLDLWLSGSPDLWLLAI